MANPETPADLEKALAGSNTARDRWAALAPSHRAEYLKWIEEAKWAETRAARVTKAVKMLAEGKPKK